MILLGFWVFWFWEKLNCNFWTISTSRIISIKKNIYTLVEESWILFTTRHLVMNKKKWLNRLDCFSSRWLFCHDAFCHGGFFPGGFLSGRHFYGGLWQSGFYTADFFSWLDSYKKASLWVACCPGGYFSGRLFTGRQKSGWLLFRLAFVGWLKPVTRCKK